VVRTGGSKKAGIGIGVVAEASRIWSAAASSRSGPPTSRWTEGQGLPSPSRSSWALFYVRAVPLSAPPAARLRTTASRLLSGSPDKIGLYSAADRFLANQKAGQQVFIFRGDGEEARIFYLHALFDGSIGNRVFFSIATIVPVSSAHTCDKCRRPEALRA
jgi:hypothetical protein